MTKKDYELIANCLAEAGLAGSWCFDNPSDRVDIARHFAGKLGQANHKFDTIRFLKAATLENDYKIWKAEREQQ